MRLPRQHAIGVVRPGGLLRRWHGYARGPMKLYGGQGPVSDTTSPEAESSSALLERGAKRAPGARERGMPRPAAGANPAPPARWIVRRASVAFRDIAR